MKKALWILSSLALAGFAFVGCDEDSNDACGGCEDEQVCAPIKDAGHSCVAVKDLKGAKDCFSSENGFVSGFAIEKTQYNDYICVRDDGKQGTVDKTCKKDADCTQEMPLCDVTLATPVCIAKDAKTIYKYVRIDDATPASQDKSNDPGADIDAVVLVKSSDGSNALKYAVDVKDFARGDKVAKTDGKQYAADPAKVLDKPDSLINYGTGSNEDICYYYHKDSNSAGNNKCNSDKSNTEYCGGQENCECDFNYTFYSLGGGHIVVEMGGAIEANDKLNIIEVSDCKLSNTGSHKGDGTTKPASKETMKVYISVSSDMESFKQTIAENSVTNGVLNINIQSKDVAAN